MTTTDTTPTGEQQPDDLDEGHQPEDEDQGAEQPERDPAAAREQRLRRERREALAERDALRSRLERYQRAEIDEAAGQVLAHGGDLLAVRPTLADFLGEDGQVDPAKVRTIAEAVAAERPHWALDVPGRRQPRGRDLPVGSPKPRAASWADVVTPSGKRGA